MIFWIYAKPKFPREALCRKGKIYILWRLSNIVITIFNTSKTFPKKSKLNSSIITETINNSYFLVYRKLREIIAPYYANDYENYSPIHDKTNYSETEKHPLVYLWHSICNNHRTLLRKHSAKKTSIVLPIKLSTSKPNLAFLCLPFYNSKTLSFQTKVMPIV
jgi:hypothetical protein